MSLEKPTQWFTAHAVAEAIQMPRACFADEMLRETEPAFDRLGMPLVTSGQFAYVFKLKLPHGAGTFAARAFRNYSADRARRYELIDEHLRAHPVPALGTFDYDADGMMINGRLYPVLVMPWIEGHTLDVYLSEVFKRGGETREVIKNLADDWLRVMSDLREANIAHGDLQHGNIIIEGGRVRLVDLDGMYVPAMRGMKACEVGHQHFQHPRRDAMFFDERLDRFSSLVIYLSLLALAEKPDLWATYHDENLLFTRADFLSPDASPLFADVLAIGGECARLAEALKDAARGAPEEVADVLAMTSVPLRSKLPAWMNTDVDMEVRPRTREAARIDVPVQVAVRDEATIRVLTTAGVRQVPVTPSSQNVQSVFSGTALPQSIQSGNTLQPDPFAAPLDRAQLYPATWFYAKRIFCDGSGWILLFGFQGFWRIFEYLLAVSFPVAMLLTLMLFTAIYLLAGYRRAYKNLAPAAPQSAIAFNAPRALLTPPPSVTSPSDAVYQASHNAPHLVGSRTQGIYHKATCEWAGKIAPRNRVPFHSSLAAQDAGFRECKVCHPRRSA